MTSPIHKHHVANKNGVTVLSLDDFSRVRQLHLGETTEISSGVSLSMLQQASEALLEIDQNSPSKVTVDNVSVNEITTIHPGQIVKTSEGRFVMVRPLHSLLLKQEPASRSPAFQQAIDLAIASLNYPAQTTLASDSNTKNHFADSDVLKLESGFTAKISESLGIKSHAQGFVISKKVVGALSIGILALVGTTLWSLYSGHKVGPNLQSTSHETIQPTLANVSSSQTKTSSSKMATSNDALNLSRFNNLSIPESKKESSSTPEKQPEEASIPKDFNPDEKALLQRENQKKTTTSTQNKSNTQSVTPSSTDRNSLSAADRQTILEYKLEARFDRSTARAKLKHFAESFPKGSRARQEVMKSYTDL